MSNKNCRLFAKQRNFPIAFNGLDFIPLFEERYDLVLPREQEKTLAPVLDYIQTIDFRNSLTSLTGYNATHSGEQISL